jgi:hypothetical protein
MGCNNTRSSIYTENSHIKHECDIRLWEEQLELHSMNFYDIVSEYNMTFILFGDLVSSKLYEEHIHKKYTNDETRKIMNCDLVKAESGTKVNNEIVHMIFFLLARPSVIQGGQFETYDKTEYIFNFLIDDQGLLSRDKIEILFQLSCKVIPQIFKQSEKNVASSEQLDYLTQLENLSIDKFLGLFNREASYDDINEQFKTNRHVNNNK